jgi:hypothetical protein
MQHAVSGDIRTPKVLHTEVERLLADPRSTRFVDDFVGQWLKLHKIAATDPDKKLYPEFSPYLQDSMVAETRAYFRELLDQDLNASYLVKSDFVMVNQKLATHYDIPNVTGTQIRRVPLPADCPRGGFLTQASILKMYTAVRKCGAWRANSAALWLEGILAGAWLAAHDEVFEAFSALCKLLRPCYGLA